MIGHMKFLHERIHSPLFIYFVIDSALEFVVTMLQKLDLFLTPNVSCLIDANPCIAGPVWKDSEMS